MALPLSSSLARCSSHAFDGEIIEAVAQEWRDFNVPAFWKAQLCAESDLNAHAKSPVGALGIAQIMPGTWQQIVRDLNWDSAFASPFDPARAIVAGARYQGQQRRAWSAAGRTGQQRNDLGLCAYNAGLGNCLGAQSRCNAARLWPEIAKCLPAVTGPLAAETMGYVSTVNRLAPVMEFRP